jgi:hypothetical protein
MAAGAEGAGVAGEGGKESGVDLRFAWWARWLMGRERFGRGKKEGVFGWRVRMKKILY